MDLKQILPRFLSNVLSVLRQRLSGGLREGKAPVEAACCCADELENTIAPPTVAFFDLIIGEVHGFLMNDHTAVHYCPSLRLFRTFVTFFSLQSTRSFGICWVVIPRLRPEEKIKS